MTLQFSPLPAKSEIAAADGSVTLAGRIMSSGASITAISSAKQHLLALVSKPAVYGSFIPLVMLLNILTGIVLPSLMAPREFGEYALVVTLFQYGLIFDLGISQLIDRRIPALLARRYAVDAERTVQHLLWLRIYISIGIYGAAAALLVAMAAFRLLPFGLDAGLLSALAGVLYMIALGPACIHRARSARRNYAVAVSILSAGLIFARLGGLYAGGVTGCFAALSLWYLGFGALFHVWIQPRISQRPGIVESALTLRQGIPLFATSLIWACYLTFNRWLAAPLLESVPFGQFAFSTNIFGLLVGAAGGFSAFYYPRVTQRLAREARFALSRELARDWSMLALAGGGAVAVGIGTSGFLLPLVYPSYVSAIPTVQTLLVAVPAMILASWLMPVLLSAGRRPGIDGFIIYPAATAILALGVRLLFREWGVVGVAAASTISALSLVGMQLFSLRATQILRTAQAVALFGVTFLVTAALGGLAWAINS